VAAVRPKTITVQIGRSCFLLSLLIASESKMLPLVLAAAFAVTAKLPPLKLVFVVDFDVRHNYGQHLLVDINSRYPIGHSSSWPGAENVLRLP
jgi:hypothetical protein